MISGEVLLSFCTKILNYHKPKVTEALALIRAIVICIDLSTDAVIFEGDYQLRVRVVNS